MPTERGPGKRRLSVFARIALSPKQSWQMGQGCPGHSGTWGGCRNLLRARCSRVQWPSSQVSLLHDPAASGRAERGVAGEAGGPGGWAGWAGRMARHLLPGQQCPRLFRGCGREASLCPSALQFGVWTWSRMAGGHGVIGSPSGPGVTSQRQWVHRKQEARGPGALQAWVHISQPPAATHVALLMRRSLAVVTCRVPGTVLVTVDAAVDAAGSSPPSVSRSECGWYVVHPSPAG